MNDEINKTFDEVEKTLIDDTFEPIQIPQKKDSASILFDLVELALDDPDDNKKLKSIAVNRKNLKEEDNLKTSNNNSIISNGFKLEISSHEEAEIHLLLKKLLDFFITFIISITVTYILLKFYSPEYIKNLTTFWKWTSLEFLLFTATFIQTFIIIGFLHIFIGYGLFKKTIASVFLGYELRKINGNQASLSQIAIRIIITPLALTPFIGNKLIEKVSGTTLKRG